MSGGSFGDAKNIAGKNVIVEYLKHSCSCQKQTIFTICIFPTSIKKIVTVSFNDG